MLYYILLYDNTLNQALFGINHHLLKCWPMLNVFAALAIVTINAVHWRQVFIRGVNSITAICRSAGLSMERTVQCWFPPTRPMWSGWLQQSVPHHAALFRGRVKRLRKRKHADAVAVEQISHIEIFPSSITFAATALMSTERPRVTWTRATSPGFLKALCTSGLTKMCTNTLFPRATRLLKICSTSSGRVFRRFFTQPFALYAP